MVRILKLGIISLIVVFIVILLISLLIPSTVRISRAINIEASKEMVYPLLAEPGNWKKWNEMINDRIQVEYIKADTNLITTKWTYANRSITGAYRLERIGNVTVVQWYFDFDLKWYPWEKFGSITFENQFGPSMERSLLNLKNLVGNSP